uniref:Uncharacterized protein n=1 Tax=Arundo donax TaxID=35708 RepID=A0A0A9BF76_ARUDO
MSSKVFSFFRVQGSEGTAAERGGGGKPAASTGEGGGGVHWRRRRRRPWRWPAEGGWQRSLHREAAAAGEEGALG